MFMFAELKVLLVVFLVLGIPMFYTAIELGAKRGIPFLFLSILAMSLVVRVSVSWLCGHTDELNKFRLLFEGVIYTALFLLLFSI